MAFNLPIALTWLRIILIPVFVGVYYLPATLLSISAKNWLAMSIFALAAITDWADGYLARKWGQTSAFGAFLDPVADKLMIVAALIVLVWLDRADVWLAMIIIGREIAISALREWMAQLGQSKSVAVAFIGKVKTVAQITAIIALLLYQPAIPGIDTMVLGTIALWVAAILTLWSMFHYLRLAAPHLRGVTPPAQPSESSARIDPSARSTIK
ncbi:MAG: CDP-diacylglycerol--glycerol-3-phosphate 3-phosphatidyltransferase [Betaproteobacteria bacterium]|nr:MAG: CDP-diacylglycerol--glycerol-3-phosphate 3-phosphatidyltransferase [Betaproteobacteria bacterium]